MRASHHRTLVIVLGYALWSLGAAPAQDMQLPILEMLDAHDQAFFSACSVKLRATFPATGFDPGQGLVSADITMTSDGTDKVILVERNDPASPLFKADRFDKDYDEAGNYRLTLAKRNFVLLGPDAWKRRVDFRTLEITPQNSVTRISADSPLIEVTPVNHPDSANLFYRYVLPLGRGFSGLLTEITGVEEQESGMVRVTARGTSFSPAQGLWELEVDLTRGCLVTQAFFQVDGGGSTSRTQAGEEATAVGPELPVLDRGTFFLASDYAISIEVLEYQRAAVPSLIADVRQAITAPGGNFTLLDHSNKDGAGAPLVVRGKKAE